jgi:hypothetical protein
VVVNHPQGMASFLFLGIASSPFVSFQVHTTASSKGRFFKS